MMYKMSNNLCVQFFLQYEDFKIFLRFYGFFCEYEGCFEYFFSVYFLRNIYCFLYYVLVYVKWCLVFG